MANFGSDRQKRSIGPEEAEALALRGLVFLAEEPDRIEPFLSLSGLSPADLRPAANQPAFLGAILDHILSDDTLILAFCKLERLTPELLVRARAKLPGAPIYD
ncbi:hypothetical protein FHS85_002863 [Rhodoligotrophos appendicifer]|uniref:DUF3572 domain-containing protein n=1 Tax=Rhodoligotrophos appendicifer TaxID=987056 RepID=UPI001FE4AE12|nr:DUF3572 domain-containing protein [Rhodoligotrophos appendicifer]